MAKDSDEYDASTQLSVVIFDPLKAADLEGDPLRIERDAKRAKKP